MNIIIGDIGNTVTKICLTDTNNFKIKQIIHFNSENVTSRNFVIKQ